MTYSRTETAALFQEKTLRVLLNDLIKNQNRVIRSPSHLVRIVMNEEPIQCIFDFESGNQDGYENFQRELEARNKRFMDVWRLPVGRKVRLTIKGVPCSFEGKLEVKEQPVAFDKREELHLNIGKTGFFHTEIESCSIIG